MIDIKELMVGFMARVNRDGLCIKKGTIVRVLGIDGESKLKEKGLVGYAGCQPLDKEQFSGGIWLDYLDPIPITPAILEKNGWFYKNGFYTKKGPVRLSWKEDGTLIVGYFQFPCAVEFVHTLQNILRILGLEDITL